MLNISTPSNGTVPSSSWANEAACQPLTFPEIEPRHAEALNAFYRQRGAVRARVGGRGMTVRPDWRNRLAEINEPWMVALDISGEPAEFVVPGPLLRALAADLDPSLQFEFLAPEHRAIVLEYALTEALEAMEAALAQPAQPCRISVLAADEARGRQTRQGAQPEFAVSFSVEGLGDAPGLLRSEAHTLLRLAKAMERQAPAAPAPFLAELPVPAHLRWAAVELTVAELKSLNAGDIILLDTFCREPETAVLVLGEHLGARVRILPGGYELLETPRPLAAADLAWCLEEHPAGSGPLAICAPKDLPITLFVELTQFQSSLAEVRALKQGAQINAVKDRDAHFDLIAAGTRIGRGALTMLGSGVGVRVVR